MQYDKHGDVSKADLFSAYPSPLNCSSMSELVFVRPVPIQELGACLRFAL